jgi:hypothetical protein
MAIGLGEVIMEEADPAVAVLAKVDPAAAAPVEVGPEEKDADDWMKDDISRDFKCDVYHTQ